MRILFIHADRLEYEVREPAIKEPEEVDDQHRQMAVDEVLVCFTTVEARDESDPAGIADRAAHEVEDVPHERRVGQLLPAAGDDAS